MLDANLGTAVLRTKLDAAGLTSGLGQVESRVRAFGDRTTLSLDKIGAGATRAGRALSVGITAPLVAVATAATNAALRLGNTADQLLDLEQQSGLSVDRLQAFGRVARAAGVDTNVLGEAAIQLSRRLREGGDESAEFAAAATALGVSVRDAQGNLRALDDIVPELITSLQGVEDVTTRNVLANQAFGRGATSLIPVLGLTADEYARLEQEARDAGEVLGRDSLDAANALRVGYEDLKAEVGVLSRDLTVALLPAATAIVGLFRDSVVPVLKSAAEFAGGLARAFGELPPVAQRAIVVFGGLAAAAGPFLIVLGNILTAVSRIGPALAALRLAALPLLGPAGLIALGVVSVGGLAIALSGRRESLDTSLDNVAKAAAGGDQASVVGALERLKSRVDESAVPAIQRMIDKLVETGELSADLRAELDQLVTGFNRTAAEAELAAVRTQIAALESQGLAAPREGGSTAEFLAFRQEQLDRGLVQAGFGPGDLRFVLDNEGRVTLQAFTDALREEGRAVLPAAPPGVNRAQRDAFDLIRDTVLDTVQAARADQTSLLDPLLRRQAELERQLATAPASGAAPGFARGTGGAGGGAGSAAAQRTVATVFAEIDRLGAAAVRIAAFEQTPEALLDSVETRIRLFDRAIEELLTSFAGDVTDAQLEFIRGRRAALRAEADQLRAALEDVDGAADAAIAAILDPGSRARLVAQAKSEAGAVALDTVLAVAARELFDPAAVIEAVDALRRVNPALAREFDELVRVARVALASFADGFVDPGTRARVDAANRRAAGEIALDTVRAYADAFEAGADTLDPETGLAAIARLRDVAPELATEFDALNRALLVLAASARSATGAFPDPAGAAASSSANRAAATAVALDTVEAFQAAFRAGTAGLDPDDGLAALDRLRAVAPEVAAGFGELNRELLVLRAGLEDSGFMDPGSIAAARAEQSAFAEAIAVDTVRALIDAGASTEVLVQALERLRAIAPEAAAAFDDELMRPIPVPGVQAFVNPPEGLEGIFGPATEQVRGVFDEFGQNVVEVSDYSSAELRAAGDAFRIAVAQAAVDFTLRLAEAIRSGDVVGAISAAFGAAGQVAGAGASFLQAGGASFLGLGASAIPGLGLAAALLPLVGSLFGGLFGGRRNQAEQPSEREAEAQRRARQTPAFTVRIQVSQVNNYGSSNVDPRVRADNDRRTRQVVADVLREIDYTGLRRAALGSAL